MLLAKIYLKSQDPAAAEKQYRLIHRHHPEEVQSLLLLAQLYLGQGKIDASRAVLENVLSISKDDYLALLPLARITSHQKDIPQAGRYYQKALAANWSTELALEAGEFFLRNRKYRQAESLYKEILARDAGDEDAGLGLVQVYLDQGKKREALVELKRLRDSSSHPFRITVAMAKLYAQEHQYGKAADILEKFLKNDDRPRVRYLLGLVYFQAEDYERALEHLQKIPRNVEQ